MDSATTAAAEAPALTAKQEIEARTAAAIDSGDFKTYQVVVMHDWLRTLSLMATLLVPWFFVLDLFMMPASFLPRFAIYRGLSTLISFLQLLVVRRTKPSRLTYLHGYIMTFQIGGMIALMTNNLGGFSSSYYAGLNLVVMGVNLLMPWGGLHTAANVLLTIALYLGFNVFSSLPADPSLVLNNLFFLFATGILATAINFVRAQLIRREFGLLVDLGKTRDDLIDKNKVIEDRERSLTSLLDLSGQGFLSFNEEFVVQAEYSKECDQIFGRPIAGLDIGELLYSDAQSKANFKNGLDLFFTERALPEVIFDLLDHQLVIGERTVKADYKAIRDDSVMIVLTDITEELRLQERSRQENEKWNLLLKVISNKAVFATFDHDAVSLFEALKVPIGVQEGLVRELHTFKGSAGFLGFVKTQAAAHALEDYIADRITLGQPIEPAGPVSRLGEAFAEERELVFDTLGPDWAEDAQSIALAKSEYAMIESHIRTNCPDQPIIEVLEEHRRKPLAELFTRFPPMIADLSTRMGKRIAPVTVLGGDFPIVPDDFEDLVGSFSHIIRNMVDHGIEQPMEREAKGKSPIGAAGIYIKEEDGEIVFTFSDDGQGIPIEDVHKRALALGLIGSSEEVPSAEIINMIFRDGFSTSTSVSEISGRGVGLSAVREAVEKMGGSIKVQTAKDRGTVFTIAVPGNRTKEAKP